MVKALILAIIFIIGGCIKAPAPTPTVTFSPIITSAPTPSLSPTATPPVPGPTPMTTPSPTLVNGAVSGHVYQLDGITPVTEGKIYYSNMYSFGLAPFSGIVKVALTTAPEPPYRTVDIATDGSYRIDGLRAGIWYLWANSPGYDSTSYTRPLEISSVSRTYQNIDFLMPALIKIGGFIYYSDGKTPYMRAIILAESIERNRFYRVTYQEIDGRYILELPEGRYWLKAADDAPVRGLKYYPNADLFDSAAPLVVKRSDTPTNYNFVMKEASPATKTVTISGYVYQADGVSPVHRTMVELWRSDGSLSQRYMTKADGYYTFKVAPGSYLISATPSDGYHSTPRFYSGAHTWEQATTVTVHTGDNLTNVNILLDPVDRQPVDTTQYTVNELGSISGYVHSRDKRRPLAGAWLEVFPLNGDRNRAVQANMEGQYTIANLPPGEYYLQCSYFDGSRAGAVLFYPGSVSMAEATRVYVAPGQALKGFDFQVEIFPYQ